MPWAAAAAVRLAIHRAHKARVAALRAQGKDGEADALEAQYKHAMNAEARRQREAMQPLVDSVEQQRRAQQSHRYINASLKHDGTIRLQTERSPTLADAIINASAIRAAVRNLPEPILIRQNSWWPYFGLFLTSWGYLML